MDTATIQKIRKGKEKARQYNFQAYQDTGEAKYERAERRYSELVDICDLALSISEIRDRSVRMNSEYMILAKHAADLKHHGEYVDQQKMKDFLYEVVDVASRFGFADPWR